MILLKDIAHHKNNNPHKTALIYGPKKWSYEELWQEILQKANILYYENSTTLLLNFTNPVDNLIYFFAGLYLGKKSIFLPKDYPKAHVNSLLASVDGVLVSDISSVFKAPAPDVIAVKTNQNDYFLGVLSSGTTGQAKVIWKDYQAWVSAFKHQSVVFGINANDNLFVVDALGYSANLNAVVHMLWQGGTVFMAKLNEVKLWQQQFDKEQISSVFLVPSHARLLENFAVNDKVNSFITAGEKLDIPLAKKILRQFPQALLTEYYGSAELGHISFHQNEEILQNPISVGKAFPEVNISIDNQLIRVESPYVSPQYRNTPTNQDLGVWHNGHLLLLGREGRMFNRRGLNIFAEEIENAAQGLEFIKELAVVGVLKANNSHEITLFYTVNDTSFVNNSMHAVRIELESKLPKSKLPNRIKQLDFIPRTQAGKINYQALVAPSLAP